VDIDRFLAVHAGDWRRLGELTDRARRRDLPAAEVEELVGLYQRVSGHLSQARTRYPDPGLVEELSGVLAAASAAIYGTRGRLAPSIGRFFTLTFPAAVWHLRRLFVVSALLTLGPALAVGLWLANSPAARDAAAPAAVRQAYVSHDFASYYRSEPAANFASQVYTNNVVVAAEAFAGGIAAGIPTAAALIENGANLGFAGGLFAAAGHPGEFWGLILPHGLLELTSVILAGAGGLRLGVTLVDPGDRRRSAALAEEGVRAVTVVLGVVVSLAVAGTIEGFVTGSGLPTVLRVGIGVTVEVLFLAWALLGGRRAAALGCTGRLGERPVPDATVPGGERAPSGGGPARSGSQSRPVDLARR
jgi:uncharacterized membrane protein SpoIIM required for sporulation